MPLLVSLFQMTAMLPNTPTSMLVRSNSLNSMNSQPKDVVDMFVKHSIQGGVNVLTNFDANNDPRNHRAVAEACHKYGGHYQAALSWAVYHPDPSIYNVKWAVEWFRQIVKDLSPHSLYVKDPSGVLTPEMAGLLSREIKAEFPDLPLIFHAHYQTGFAYAAYLEAMKNGANGVECSLGFPDGAGQPYSLSMLRMVEDFGLETGRPNKQAMHAVNQLCKTLLRPLYASANVVRTPDIEVEKTGIAGGQRSILDKELIDAGQGHLIPSVDSMVQQVRKEGGLVCQVTPAADSYAREAMRRIRGGPSDRSFTPGYAQILVGENGSTKEAVDEKQKRVALDERVRKRLGELVNEKKIDQSTADVLLGQEHTEKDAAKAAQQAKDAPLNLWRRRMDELAAPVIQSQRRDEVNARIAELEYIASKPELKKSLEIKIRMAQENAKPGTVESKVGSIDDRLKVLKGELADISIDAATAKKATEFYHFILLGKASSGEFEKIVTLSPASARVYKEGKLSLANVKDLLANSGTITCSSSLLLPDSLEQSRKELTAFEEQHCLGLMDSPEKAEENTLLWACFNKAAIPNLLQNFFLASQTGDLNGFFPKLFKGDKEEEHSRSWNSQKKKLEKAEAKSHFLYRNLHARIEEILAHERKDYSEIVSRIKEENHQALLLEYRAEKWADKSIESARIAESTKTRLRQKIAGLHAKAAEEQKILENVLEKVIREHPGSLQTTYPVFDKTTGKPSYAKLAASTKAQAAELQLAKDALKQILQHK